MASMSMRKKVMVGGSKEHRTMGYIRSDGVRVEVPCYEGFVRVGWVVLGSEILQGRQEARKARLLGITKDLCKVCAIAIAGKRQMNSPMVIVGADHAYIAEVVCGMPEKNGVDLYGDGQRWVMRAYEGTSASRYIVNLNDIDERQPDYVPDEEIDPDTHYQVVLKPRRPSEQADGKAEKNATNPDRVNKGVRRQPGKDRLLEGGTRQYSGRVWV